jgi:AraC-like DNA-binding protein
MKTIIHRPDSSERKHYTPSQKIAVSLHPRLLYAGFLEKSANWEEKPHSHNFLEIIFVKSGSGTIAIGSPSSGGEYFFEAKQGDIVIHNPNVLHREKSSPGESLGTLFFGAQNVSLEGLPENSLIPEGTRGLVHTEEQTGLFELLFTNLVSECNSSKVFSRELSESLARMILIMILRIISEHDEKFLKHNESFSRIKAYVDQNYLHINNVESLCGEVFISKFHLIRLFKRYLDIPPHTYIIQKKMEMAKIFLRESNMNIQSIASRCGYEDCNYFYKVFKKYQGETALEYRKRHT